MRIAAPVPDALRDVVPFDAEYRYGLRLAAISTPDGRHAFAWSFDGFDAVAREGLADALREFSEVVRDEPAESRARSLTGAA